MKELELSFIGRGEVKGFRFTQVTKNHYGYIYRVEANDSEWFEVFERKENKKYDCISYPRSKSFGRWAWCCKTSIKAGDKLEEIIIRKESNNG